MPLTNGTEYYYTVQAVNATGTGVSSNEASATPAGNPNPPPSVAGFNQPVMSPPVGTRGTYTTSALIWQDTFSGTTLDTTHWSNNIGGPMPQGVFATYTAPTVNNGLTLVQSGNGQPQQAVNTFDPVTQTYLFKFPTAGFFIQINAKMSDMSQGFFPALWFPTSTGTPGSPPEIDLFEGGLIGNGGNSGNTWWEGNYGGQSVQWAGFSQGFVQVADMTAQFRVYGMEWIPGVSCTFYFNGVQVHQTLESNTGGIPGEITPGYPNGGYNFMMCPQHAPAGSSAWHTQGSGAGTIEVAEVQVYNLP